MTVHRVDNILGGRVAASKPDMKVLIVSAALALAVSACQPKVQLVAPADPIRIELNVKIDQEIRVRLDKDVEDLIASNPDLF